MINLRAVFVISVLISGLIFSPSYSFAQSNQNDNPLSSLFEMFMQLFSFGDDDSEPVIEFGDAIIVQTSGTSSTSDTNDNNIPPTADAGDNQTVMEFEKVTLDSSSSTDSDGTIMSFKWTQVSGTSVTLSSMTHPSPMFNAPNVDTQDPLQNILTFMLAVVDNSSGTDSDKVNITVNKKDDPTDPEPADPEPPGNENGGNKVTICHAPPGNPNNAHTITVGTYAAQAHLTHHDEDYQGACDGTINNNDNENKNDNSGEGNQNIKDENKKSNSGKDKDENANKSNSGKGNNNDDDRKDNSGKGNQNIKDENKKSNSGKDKEDNANKSNSGKNKEDNANKSNSGKDKEDNANKSNSGKDKEDNANKSNSKLNNNDD